MLLSSTKKSKQPHLTPLVDEPTQMQELHARGIQVDATGFTEEQCIIVENEHYAILDGTLFHLHRPCTKGKDRVTLVVQQLCLPRTLQDEVIRAYHDHNGQAIRNYS